jgi:hypothetical protein
MIAANKGCPVSAGIDEKVFLGISLLSGQPVHFNHRIMPTCRFQFPVMASLGEKT